MKKDFLFDGTYEGLLSVLYYIVNRKEQINKIAITYLYQENFIVEKEYVDTDIRNSKKVYYLLKRKLSNDSIKNSYYAFLSEDDGIYTKIYSYYMQGLKYGKKLDLFLTNEDVYEIQKVSKKVSNEIHRYLGILRFKELENDYLYAKIKPDNNILTVLAKHFKSRLPQYNWIIHDENRKIAVIYNKAEWIISEFDLEFNYKIPKEEYHYQNLWKQYFNNVSIKSRENKKLQKKYIPTRYWKHLVEFF
ncbi:MAG: TIGR03915 family putative DNA repair protein [Clostridiales bacterium]